MSSRTLNTLMGSHSPTANGLTVHGGGRRSRPVRLSPAELADWTAAVEASRAAYHRDSPRARRFVAEVALGVRPALGVRTAVGR